MDKDKRAQFDRGEIDGDGNPTAPFGFGGGRGGGFRSGGPGGGSHEFSGEGADFGDIFEGLFGGGRRQPAGGGFGGFGRSAPPQKGGTITYRLAVQFIDAGTLAPQRITLTDGKTKLLKLPKCVADGTQTRVRGKGTPGHGRAGGANT